MKSNRILIETLLVGVITVVGLLYVPSFKLLFAFLPTVYLMVERRARKRTWAETGIIFSAFGKDLRSNLGLVILVGVIMQPLTVFAAKIFLPDFIAHVQARLPSSPGLLLLTLPMMAVSVFGEELAFRVLIQGRLSGFVGTAAALLIGALAFALVHYSPGTLANVCFDLGTIFIDAILLGVIFARCNNASITWVSHLVGNVMGLLAIILVG